MAKSLRYKDGSPEDLARVKCSILADLGRGYQEDNNVTVGQVVNDVWNDLDVSLVGCGEKHTLRRIVVVRQALTEMGLDETSTTKVEDYFTNF